MEKTLLLIQMSSIPQFRNVVIDISNKTRFSGIDENGQALYNNAPLPTLKFIGTVKLHGTNASICFNGDSVWAQSKENIISPEKDNAGFATFVHKNLEYIKKVFLSVYPFGVAEICIYGEWAGKGIQKGVAISEIEKTFFMFGYKYRLLYEDFYRWGENTDFLEKFVDKEKRFESVFNFKTYEIEIDFNNPSLFQNKMIEMTEEVDKLCPIGEAFGVVGHGEGIVWNCFYQDSLLSFKVKGESHSKSKIKTLKPVDDAKEQTKIDFANYACPTWRLEQMYNETFDFMNGGLGDIKKMGDFLRALNQDILKEELDILAEKDLTMKDVGFLISKIGREYFIERLNEQANNL
jgi:hypothetical protein